MSRHLISYIFKAALRDRLMLSVFLMMGVGASLSIFLGSAAALEKDQFAIVFMAGSLRIASMVALILFVIFYVRRSFDGKDVEFILSKSVGRVSYILSHVAAFSVLAMFVSLLCGLCVYAVSGHYFGAGHLLWLASVVAENIIMVNVALFFAMVVRSAVSASIATLGFYVLGRMMGQILGIIDAAPEGFLLNDILSGIMQMVSIIIPRLDLMGQTSWLIYGAEGDVIGYGYIFAQCAVFLLLVISASVFDLLRQKF